MSNTTYEGTIVNGQVRLPAGVQLPENSRVQVIVPDAAGTLRRHIYSPRLAHPEQAKEFEMEEAPDAVYDDTPSSSPSCLRP